MRGWTAVIEFRVSGTTPLLCRGDEELGRFHMPSDVCAEHSHRWSRHFLRGGSPFLLEFSARPCGWWRLRSRVWSFSNLSASSAAYNVCL